MPDPDHRGMYTKDIDKEKIEKAVAAIAAGGRENVEGLIDMLGEPGAADNVKPHYALHCVLNYTKIANKPAEQREFCDALAGRLGGDLSDYNKAYLCQELMWFGDKSAVPALAALLTNEALCDPAGMALVAIGEGAAEALREALPKAQGGRRRTIVHSLAALAEPGDKASAAVFVAALADDDRETRIAAGAGLANIADPAHTGALLGAADAANGWERIKQNAHCLKLAENFAAAKDKASSEKVYKHLRDTRTDTEEKHIRDAAAAALA